MNDIKFGLKLWSTNKDLIKKAEDFIRKDYFHYIELTYIPKTKIKHFTNKNIPFVLHLPTSKQGFNIGSSNEIENKSEIINESIKWADKLNAMYIIIHPGYGDINNSLDFLKKVSDDRFIIENMPKCGLNKEKMLGYNSKQIRQLKGHRFGFCFDLNHAIKASLSLNKDYKNFIREFLKLKPDMFHISDGMLNNQIDEHLDLECGEYDWDFLSNIIKKSNCNLVTLETPRRNLNDDLRNLEIIKSHMID